MTPFQEHLLQCAAREYAEAFDLRHDHRLQRRLLARAAEEVLEQSAEALRDKAIDYAMACGYRKAEQPAEKE